MLVACILSKSFYLLILKVLFFSLPSRIFDMQKLPQGSSLQRKFALWSCLLLPGLYANCGRLCHVSGSYWGSCSYSDWFAGLNWWYASSECKWSITWHFQRTLIPEIVKLYRHVEFWICIYCYKDIKKNISVLLLRS